MSFLGLGLLAILNGVLIGLTRALNGRLSASKSAFKASFWNHLVGWISLSPFIAVFGFPVTNEFNISNLWIFSGGLWGCIFVSLSSFAFVRLGALVTALLVIGGQLITSQFIDHFVGHYRMSSYKTLGTLLIVVGVGLSFWDRNRRQIK